MSDELKPCPFCGSKNTTLDYFEISCPQELGTLVLCGDCGSYSTSVDRWNTRPIEDALNKRIAELRDVIGDYRNDVSRVLDEKCPSDERHCGCVPILRDQLNKYQKALILITTMPELSQATIAREALQERGKFIWTEQSVGEYWVTKLDILQDKFDTLEKDYADVCQKRLEAADVFSRQIIELESENAELKADLKNKNARIAELEAESERFTVHSDIERQDDKWIPVSERLPDNWESVLTIDISKSTRDMVTAFYNPETSLWSTHFSCDLWVTHWMPLPEPPILYGKVCEE